MIELEIHQIPTLMEGERLKMLKPTPPELIRPNASPLRVQDMDKEERRRHVEELGREIAHWSADLNRRLA